MKKPRNKLPKKTKISQLAYSLRDLLDYYPISETKAFEAAGVHRTTWRRWLAGTSKPPRATVQLIRLLSMGALPDPAFNGFTCHSGLIFDETNTGFTPGDIRSIPFFRSGQAKYISALKQIDELRLKLTAIESNSSGNMLHYDRLKLTNESK